MQLTLRIIVATSFGPIWKLVMKSNANVNIMTKSLKSCCFWELV